MRSRPYARPFVFFWFIAGVNIVDQWMRRPVLRFGRYIRTLGPGFSWTEPFTCRRLEDIPINEEVWALKVDSIQTHDNVPITFTLILTSKIDEPNVSKYVTAVLDGDDAVEQRTLAVASEAVSGMELDAILHDRQRLHDKLIELLNSRVSHWGILIVAVEFKDIKITDSSIEQAIAMKARAVKEAEAELARAQKQVEIAEEVNTPLMLRLSSHEGHPYPKDETRKQVFSVCSRSFCRKTTRYSFDERA
jgi:regulator of protease activity HflC (stomatin/prohibitin superfamily)